MRVYISGKITGLNIQIAQEYFDTAEAQLQQKGMVPVNPMKLSPYNPTWTWEQYMLVDIEALFRCEAIFMLDNWQQSKGARVEHAIAHELGLKIFYSYHQIPSKEKQSSQTPEARS